MTSHGRENHRCRDTRRSRPDALRRTGQPDGAPLAEPERYGHPRAVLETNELRTRRYRATRSGYGTASRRRVRRVRRKRYLLATKWNADAEELRESHALPRHVLPRHRDGDRTRRLPLRVPGAADRPRPSLLHL